MSGATDVCPPVTGADLVRAIEEEQRIRRAVFDAQGTPLFDAAIIRWTFALVEVVRCTAYVGLP
jgi:hypothetical protein